MGKELKVVGCGNSNGGRFNMRSLFEIMGITENKKEDERKTVFKETDPNSPFPNDTVSALKREINTGAKDLETEWESALHLIDHAFEKLEIPKPKPNQKERWSQYNQLIADSVKQLHNARGLDGNWRTSNK